MTPDPIDGTGILPTVLLIALCLWTLGALILAPAVGRLLRHVRRANGPQTLWDRHNDPWDRDPVTGLYRLRAVNSDGHLQAMDQDDVENTFGPTSLEPRKEPSP